MRVTAEVSRMPVHSAIVARRKRGHSESGIRCPGSSSFRVILVAVKPMSSDRLKFTNATLPTRSLHSFWKRQTGLPMFSCGPMDDTGWTFQPGILRWRLICNLMATFSYLSCSVIFLWILLLTMIIIKLLYLVVHVSLSLMQVCVVVEHHDASNHSPEA